MPRQLPSRNYLLSQCRYYSAPAPATPTGGGGDRTAGHRGRSFVHACKRRTVTRADAGLGPPPRIIREGSDGGRVLTQSSDRSPAEGRSREGRCAA